MEINKTQKGILYIIAAYAQILLWVMLAYFLPVGNTFLAFVGLSLLLSIYITLILLISLKRRKIFTYAIIASIQILFWLILSMFFPSLVAALFLLLCAFLVFGLSARGLVILFSKKKNGEML